MIRRRTIDVLFELVALAGRKVVDIGCGDGTIARLMAQRGALVTGVETSPDQLARARASAPMAGETYVEGVAEHLPCADEAFDAAVLFNSLHHAGDMAAALDEAWRVVVPNGLVLVMEPLPSGSFFELVRAVDDETRVRGLAQEAIKAAYKRGFAEEREAEFEHVVRLADFTAFTAKITAFDDTRKAKVAACRAALEEDFLRLGQRVRDSFEFTQPSRAVLLRRLASRG